MVDLESYNVKNWAALYWFRGSLDELEEWFEDGTLTDLTVDNGWYANLAAENDHPDVLKFLFEKEPKFQDYKGRLLLRALNGGAKDCIRYLITKQGQSQIMLIFHQHFNNQDIMNSSKNVSMNMKALINFYKCKYPSKSLILFLPKNSP